MLGRKGLGICDVGLRFWMLAILREMTFSAVSRLRDLLVVLKALLGLLGL